MQQVGNPFTTFNDLSGRPLENGYVYIGTANLDPETNPIAVYLDAAGLIPAVQPLRTVSGYVASAGSPVRIYVGSTTFSIRVRTAAGVQVFYQASVGSDLQGDLAATTGSLLVGWIRAATGAVARTASSLFTERVPTPLDFMPFAQHAAVYAGTSTYDAADAIEKAAAVGRGVYFPGKRYSVSRGIDFLNADLRGEGGFYTNSTQIHALQAMEYMFKYGGDFGHISNFRFMANSLAKVGVLCENSNSARIQSCQFWDFKQSGVRFSSTGNNSNSMVSECGFNSSGTAYTTGTATVAAGSNTVTITGAANLTTLIRSGFTYIKLPTGTGRDARAHLIRSATSTTLTVYPIYDGAYTGVAYSILDGNCIEFQQNGDNSQIKVYNCTMQAAPAGICDQALYAHHDQDCTFESVGWSHVLGNPSVTSPLDFFSHRAYTENLTSGSLFNCASNSAPVFEPASAFSIYEIWTPDVTVFAKAPRAVWRGVRFLEQISTSADATAISADFGLCYHITQTANNCTVNLPAMTANTNKTDLAKQSHGRITFVLGALGTRTVTFKSADWTVNGVAGTTGSPFTADNKIVSATPGPSNNWVVS